jgi:hypothetical protein
VFYAFQAQEVVRKLLGIRSRSFENNHFEAVSMVQMHVPHVVLSNFPSERGYVATLSENVDAMIAAVRNK